MQRPDQYGDPGVNSLMAAQMQHMSTQRMQYNSGRNQFSGRADEEHQYMSSNTEGQWQWDRGIQKGANAMSPHMYKEDQGSDVSRSAHNNLRSDSKMASEKQMVRDSRGQLLPNQDEMEYGYEDIPQTFETLEQKFLQDIMKLTKEHQEAEDQENARHREKLNEINSKYLENLMTTRARQATHRDDFLLKEMQALHQQYRHACLSSYHNNTAPSDAYAGSYSATAALAVPHQSHERVNFEPYRGGRGRGSQSRGQHRGGRSYNSGGRYY
ncbi:hypothetical protein AXF42_Ash018357 [Apostasia shenzhenica]|uniref:Uncharacterized protein n=1 Tax=Apostasia shenzhenica TaxID=1088818 RepID=A0A2H9ZR92_9ASPA|nr:hypothetical protein AXF42_Ash018357 [Apostasia shenzhenica]